MVYDDELNFRDGPSVGADIVTSLTPLSDDLDISALGEAWAAPNGVWWKVAVVGEEVWANQAYLGSLRIDVDIVFDAESGEPGAQDVAFVVLTGVDITPICGRGTSEGLCV